MKNKAPILIKLVLIVILCILIAIIVHIESKSSGPVMIDIEPVFPPIIEVTETIQPTLEFNITYNEPEVNELLPKAPAKIATPDEVVESVELVEVVEEEEPEVVAPYILSDYERSVVEKMVMGEIGGEGSYEGEMLVAQCILNAVLRDGITPSQVRIDYQYSGWNDYPSDSVKEAVSAVFDRGEKVVDEYILYFYAPQWVYSAWHESQVFVIELGNTKFFSERS